MKIFARNSTALARHMRFWIGSFQIILGVQLRQILPHHRTTKGLCTELHQSNYYTYIYGLNISKYPEAVFMC